ncbi:CaiB/BaiF CoA transferase family protein [Orrella dioscoreae]|uniref:L-carnitine dehydratase/bile acid-inducible protein F n=1 Tax=Orrella dioscoreae TaxID=1851544 RepID=A0A1C3K4S3_9BURK|nr:CaiB/BaiF CoA-transferase family protein [Orrella dioscoreae]SBT26377.1 L-carnitine dehydratase/bile acid-inducible protein F [Orrella dioscoreae]SOE46563.1 L-carnitine dehydratase/bile acid-inducible protein F [Orrella dioscoreae]
MQTEAAFPATAQREGPLKRFRVLDLTRVRAGPTCIRQFADWGADVIKIESPDHMEVSDGWGGLRDGPDFQNLHRNKRSLTLNLKDPKGREIFLELVKQADVVAENFRPDVKFRLGIDYETLKAVNPRIVYASISGFGQDGPYAKRPGFDHIVQGMGGLMSITGDPSHGPMRTGIAVADTGAGLYCAMAIMTALLEREESGQGQWVQVSLLQAMIAMCDFQAARWLFLKEIPGQPGNNHPTSIPTGVYPTADGYINIAAGEQAMFRRLCTALEVPELMEREPYSTEQGRSDNRVALNAELSALTRQRSTADWMVRMEECHVAAGPINRMNEVFADAQVQHLGIATPVKHKRIGPVEVVGQPFMMSRTPSQVRSAAPDRGEDTEEILRELNYSAGQIAALREQGVL